MFMAALSVLIAVRHFWSESIDTNSALQNQKADTAFWLCTAALCDNYVHSTYLVFCNENTALLSGSHHFMRIPSRGIRSKNQ